MLLVEDDREVAALTSEMLDSIGYEVTHVASPAAALGALANGRRFDVVFSDVMMPGGMSGVDLAREIQRRRPDMPIMLATGYIEAARDAVAEGLEVLSSPTRSKRWSGRCAICSPRAPNSTSLRRLRAGRRYLRRRVRPSAALVRRDARAARAGTWR